jgi:sterol desaturase/sphingolipid hydroxylase (fatty acid hydroxylase superfamily)
MSVNRTDELRASPRMFDSDWMDRLSRVHPAVPPVIFGPAIAVMLWLGIQRLDVLSLIVAIVGGYVAWTLAEYWIHRIIFHFEPEKGIGARLHWIIHGVHHDHPNDPKRLVMPPSVSIPGSALFFLVFWLVLGPDLAPAFGAGFFAGYLFYDSIHYHLHHHAPRTRAGRWLRELHMRHHFQDDTRGFGISAPWWDTVFGTPTRQRTAR